MRRTDQPFESATALINSHDFDFSELIGERFKVVIYHFIVLPV
jgi:hypothetical protein